MIGFITEIVTGEIETVIEAGRGYSKLMHD